MDKIKPSTRIVFLHEITEGPTEETPSFLFARKGEGGAVTGYSSLVEKHTVTWDGWPHDFYATYGKDFVEATRFVKFLISTTTGTIEAEGVLTMVGGRPAVIHNETLRGDDEPLVDPYNRVISDYATGRMFISWEAKKENPEFIEDVITRVGERVLSEIERIEKIEVVNPPLESDILESLKQ